MPKCVKIATAKRNGVRDYEYTVYATDDRRVELFFENDQVTVSTVLPWDVLRNLVSGLTEAADMCGASL